MDIFSIDKMISKNVLPPDPYTTDLAEEHYSNCVRKLVDTLCGAYQVSVNYLIAIVFCNR